MKQGAGKVENCDPPNELLVDEGNAKMYHFLACLFQNEVSPEQLEFLRNLDVPQDSDRGVIDGLALMQQYINQSGLDPITDLSADFAQLFLNAGNRDQGLAPHPYESVYTSETRLIMQEARDQVADIYTSFELQVNKALAVPEDHIGIELEFLAYLSQLTRPSNNTLPSEVTVSPLQAKKDFLEHHLLNWIPLFCTDVMMQAKTTFYRGLARLTECFLQEEHRLTCLAMREQ